jgi:soluble lytic murein transglycosylase-like protein
LEYARGLGQFMYSTALDTAYRHGLASFSTINQDYLSLFDPDINIELICVYLSELVKQTGSYEKALDRYYGSYASYYRPKILAWANDLKQNPQLWEAKA